MHRYSDREERSVAVPAIVGRPTWAFGERGGLLKEAGETALSGEDGEAHGSGAMLLMKLTGTGRAPNLQNEDWKPQRLTPKARLGT